MGSFLFTPDQNGAYTAIIRAGNNKPVIKALPPVTNDGYIMQLTDDHRGQLDVSVSSNSNPAGNVYIFIHTRQIIKLAREASLINGVVHFRFDRSLLDEGISHITIFDSERHPVCERLYFKRPDDKLFINAHPDQQQYSCRSKAAAFAVEANNKY